MYYASRLWECENLPGQDIPKPLASVHKVVPN